MNRPTKTIDAAGRSLGRLASEIAILLRGKDRPDFAPHKDEGGVVIVDNIAQMKITGNKLKTKIYYHHSGWPGGFKKQRMEEVIAKKGRAEVLKRAVWGMLPKNKLRPKIIKRLKFSKSKIQNSTHTYANKTNN